MFDKQKIIFTDNVAIVQSEDSNSSLFHTISTNDFYKFTGDLTATIKINPVERGEVDLKDNIDRLFGAWVQNGEEDRMLQNLYSSRLKQSSLPDEEG